ncbi:hypothetical protein [Stutzerimonas stutzeri]|uniref:hypothetical protein n=1 Tax=Stutzerimonas TaxID=2901164 RepID=UPI001BAEFB35|nr:hypothetical protein [Stutzerimonas stutzeri]QUE74388.1 hypothetical protein KCX70_13970 [Stutzerimonas stutzeri]
MTLYTDGLIIRRDRNILDDVVTGQFDAAEAAAVESFVRSPIPSAYRNNELTNAEKGPVEMQAYPAYGIPERRAEPETPLLTAEQARARIKEEGLDLIVEDSGIRAGALDILIERKRAENQRKFILDNAPASTIPIQLLAGFAASAIDPVNIAAAFVPVIGPTRYAAMLAKTGSTAGRFGVRAGVGALEGAVGTALVEPIVLNAAKREQADYDLADSLLNVTFGTVLGGGLHSVGGYVSDAIKARTLATIDAEAPRSIATPTERSTATLPQALGRISDDSMEGLRLSLARGIEADRSTLAAAASRQAADELTPIIRADLESSTAGRQPNVRDLKAERETVQVALERIDESFKVRAKEFQATLPRKQAERAAREAIEGERQQLTARRGEIDSKLELNRQAEQAGADLASIRRGEIPDSYRARVAERADEIARGFDLKDTARAKAEAAPWQVRENALRAAVAQSVTGRPVSIEAVFDLADPVKRPAALEQIKQPATRSADPAAGRASRAADDALKTKDIADPATLDKLLADELALTDEMVRQAGINPASIYREADELLADAETYAAAYRAAALCQLRN